MSAHDDAERIRFPKWRDGVRYATLDDARMFGVTEFSARIWRDESAPFGKWRCEVSTHGRHLARTTEATLIECRDYVRRTFAHVESAARR